MKRHYSVWKPELRDWVPACGKEGEMQVALIQQCDCEDCLDAMKAAEVIAHAKRLQLTR